MAKGGPYNLGRNGVGDAFFVKTSNTQVTMVFLRAKPIGNPGPSNAARTVQSIVVSSSNNTLYCTIDLSGNGNDVRDEDTFAFRLTQQDRVVTLATSTDSSDSSSSPTDPYAMTSNDLAAWATGFVVNQDLFLEWDTEGTFADAVTFRSIHSNALVLTKSEWPKVILGDGTASGTPLNKMLVGTGGTGFATIRA